MIRKILIFISFCNFNFIANYPIEDFSIDHNKTENNEYKEGEVQNGVVDVDFELIHENEKVIKSKYESHQV
jgi:hypothetical protein